MSATSPRRSGAVPGRVGPDLLRAPIVGRFLRWRHARPAAQVVTGLLAALVVYDGLFGPQLAPKNVAGVLPWVQWRGLVVFSLLLVGNVFCFACPFVAPRRVAKRLGRGRLPWPRRLSSKWLAVAILVLFFWAYEAFDFWASPALTAWLVLAYFAAAFLFEAVFRGSAFCKHVCPIGQFHFVNSAASCFEVAARDVGECASCATKDCIRGRGAARRRQDGCQLWLFQPRKIGNADCTFCLDCAHACPHNNVGVLARAPAAELADDRPRSSLGTPSRRLDLAALYVIVTFAAFVNAFGMVAPVYSVERWLASASGLRSEPLVLALLFLGGLVALPGCLVLGAAAESRRLSATRRPLARVAARHAYGLLPIGFGMWLAHYGYHFLTGALTIVPVAQSLLTALGVPIFGQPRWGMGQVVPTAWLVPIELVLLQVGALVSLVTSFRIAEFDALDETSAMGAFLPWAVLIVLLSLVGVWLLLQPMEMRGTFVAG